MAISDLFFIISYVVVLIVEV